MSFDPFSSGLAEPLDFDPFSTGEAEPAQPEEETFDPFAAGQAAETPDSIKQRLYAPGSQVIPTSDEAAILFEAEQQKPFAEKAGDFGSALLNAIPQTLGAVKTALHQGLQQSAQQTPDSAPSALVPSPANQAGLAGGIMEAAARGTYDIANLVRKGYNVTRDRFTEGDPAQKFYARLLEDLEVARQRERIAQGKENLLVKNLPINQGFTEAASYVLDPSVVIPGVGVGAGTAAKTAGRGIISKAVGKAGATAEKAGTVVENVARMPQEALKNASVPFTAGVAGTLGAAGLAAPALKVAAGLKATEKVAAGVKNAGEFTKHIADTQGVSQFSRLEQVAMNEAAPEWVRGAARNLGRMGIDRAGTGILNTTKTAGKGAAIGTALAAPGAESYEELGAAAGSGFALGGLAHIALAPFTSGAQKKLAEDADLFRWREAKSPEEQAAIDSMILDRSAALKVMTAEHIANGVIGKDSNVKFQYLPKDEFEKIYGGSRGVALTHTPTAPTVVVNTGRAKEGTFYHELFHALDSASDVVDYPQLSKLLFDLTDDKGTVIRKGLLSEEDLKRHGDTYFSRFDDATRAGFQAEKAAFDTNPKSPEAEKWRERMSREVAAEVFSNLANETQGNLLKKANSPIRRLADWAVLQSSSEGIKNFAKRFAGTEKSLKNSLDALALTPEALNNIRQDQKAKGPGYGAEDFSESDIFPGLKANPEIYATLRGFVRNKKNLTEKLTFDERTNTGGLEIDIADTQKPGGERIVAMFEDNDAFKKNPDGSVMLSGNRPVILTDAEVKKVQQNRAKVMMDALSQVPDKGDPGAVRKVGNGDRFDGTKFTDEQLAALKAIPNDILTPKQKAKIEELNNLLKSGDGSPILLHYNAATKEGKAKKDPVTGILKRGARKYAPLRESIRVISPLSIQISKQGNFLVTSLDITKFNDKLNRWVREKPKAFEAFSSIEEFRSDVYKYLANHEQGQQGHIGLDPNGKKAVDKKDAIKDFFNMGGKESAALLPNRLSNDTDKDILIRSFRFDRINKIAPAGGDKMPINYQLQKANFQPEGESPKLFHGSVTKGLKSLRAGSMLTEDSAWASGYATQFRPDFKANREVEEFAGTVYEVAPFKPKNPAFAKSLHDAEARLLQLAEQTGEKTSTLQQAAAAVNRKLGHDAVVAVRDGKIVGMIPLVDVPVGKELDPKTEVKTALSAGRNVASNLRKIVETEPAAFSPDVEKKATPEEPAAKPTRALEGEKISVEGKEYTGKTKEFAIARAIWDGALSGWSDPRIPSFSPDVDKAYLASVEIGDKKTAQQLVEDAAKSKGFTGPVWHGTRKADFTAFDLSKVGKTTDSGFMGTGVYFTDNKKEVAEYYAGNGFGSITEELKDGPFELNSRGAGVGQFYVGGKILEIEKSRNGAPTEKFFDVADALGVEVPPHIRKDMRLGSRGTKVASDWLADQLRANGYSGARINLGVVWGKPVHEWVVVEPKLIKSAEPILKDDKGQVIPLSRRFDTNTDDIRYSPDVAAPDIQQNPKFREWFGGSKVVDPQGKPKMVFHGSARPDRIGTEFKKKRATSGPMAYFTENPEIASNYSKNKPDNTIEHESYNDWFKVKIPGQRNEVNIVQAWHYLTPEQRQRLAENLPKVGEEGYREGEPTGVYKLNDESPAGKGTWDHSLKEARGNWLKAAVDVWLDSGMLFGDEPAFLNVLKAAGFDSARLDDPNAMNSGVVPVYLAIKNPLKTDDIPPNVVEALDRVARRSRKRGQGWGVDQWDKNNIGTPTEWIDELKRDLAAGENSYAWTRIPDWVTKTLREMGYDGVQDTGGKGGGPGHQVWIPFEPTQIKAAYGNRGTFDPTKKNITYSPDVSPANVRRLKAGGMSVPLIARELKMKPSEVGAILKTRPDREEKAVLGEGQPLFSPDVKNSPPPSSLQEFRDKWKAQGVENFVSESKGVLTLSEIRVPRDQRNKGIGTKFMEELAQYADKTGQKIKLTPSTDFGATSAGRLRTFYRRFGFVENRGKNKDFTISEAMYRLPKERQ